MTKHGKIAANANAFTKEKHMRKRKKGSEGRKGEGHLNEDISEHQDLEDENTLILQRNNKRKGKGTSLPQSQHLFLQPPSVAISEVDNQQIRMIPTPPNIVRRELSTGHMAASTDSEHTMSAGPSTSTSHMSAGPSTSNSEPNRSTGNSELSNNQNKTFIHPIANKSFEPVEANRKIMPCIMRIFPEAVKTFTAAPQHLKDVFNEFKKKHQWDPNDEDVVRRTFETKAKKMFSETLSGVREKLANGEGAPGWMSDHVLAQYHCMWKTPEFKKISEKNRRNRNSDCGGRGPSLHTGGSIPFVEHRRRMEKKLEKEITLKELFDATHMLKKGEGYVCPKYQQTVETVDQLKQTQPEVAESTIWLEATGGVKKEGYVPGFGSDSLYYFPEAMMHRKSKTGTSTSHATCEARIKQLEEQNRTMQQQYEDMQEQNRSIMETFKKMEASFAVFSAHPEWFASSGPNFNSNPNNQGPPPVHNNNSDDDTLSPSEDDSSSQD